MNTAAAAPTSGLERRYEDAKRLLRIDPTTVLRTLDDIQRPPSSSANPGVYQDALALRVVANSMLGLHHDALDDARKLDSAGQTSSSRIAVASWLLTYSGDHAELAAPLMNGGCGNARCGHDPAVDLALQAVQQAGDTADRLQAAEAFAAIVPSTPTFRLAQVKVLRDAGQLEEAVQFLMSASDPAMRKMAGVLLYDAGRYQESTPLLIGSDGLYAAAQLGSLVSAGVDKGSGVPAYLADKPALRAIFLEAAGRWKEASLAWSVADRGIEAWESALMAGGTASPVEGTDSRWRWRYYAITGQARPGEEPTTEHAHKYAAIGRASELLSRVATGERPRLARDEADPFRLGGLLRLVANGYDETVLTARRLIAINPPDRPMDVLPKLGRMPAASDWDQEADRRRAWMDWVAKHPAPSIPGPKTAQVALLAKTLNGDAPTEGRQLAALLKDLPVAECVTAVGIVLARDWSPGNELSKRLVDPQTLRECLEAGDIDLLPTLTLLAGAQDLPEDLRRIAGEISGALVAQAQARGNVSPEAGQRVAAVIKAAISEITPVEEVLGPIAAYELELKWADARRSILAGPVLASRAGMDARSAGVPRGSKSRLYGPLGRARILTEAGNLEAALGAAEAAKDADSEERAAVIAEIRASLAQRLASVGQIDRAIELVIEAAPEGADAAGAIARRIVDEHEGKQFDAAIAKLKRLHEAFPEQQMVAVSYANLLNRRSVVRLNDDQSVGVIMQDLRLAMELDPDHLAIRGNLAYCHVQMAMKSYERDPRSAIFDVRKAYSLDPNNSDLRQLGSQVVMASGAQLLERRQIGPAKDAVDFALELDPSNDQARQARNMLMYR